MKAEIDYPLKALNTFGITAFAKYFYEAGDINGLKKVLKEYSGQPIFILGGGSNILLTHDFNGLVVKNSIKGVYSNSAGDENDDVLITFGGGEIWDDAVQYAVNKGLGGLENLSGIPGTVGAAPIQNIGAYGIEQKSAFHSLRAVDIKTQRERIFTPSECQFGYRNSIFKQSLKGKYVITEVTYRLQKHTQLNTSYAGIRDELQNRKIVNPTIRDIRDIVVSIRKSQLPDPKKLGNAGSFFKNPVIDKKAFDQLKKEYPDIPSYPQPDEVMKISAGWLIEQCGYKGKLNFTGTCGVYEKQALILVNYGNANEKEILGFSKEIRGSVQTKFKILLENEVSLV